MGPADPPDGPGQSGARAADDAGQPILEPGLYQPTFLYEALWNIGVVALVLILDRRLRLGKGRAFALYVMGYTVGRFWIELMRTDEANLIFGVRLNVWTAALVFLGALIYFVRVRGPREYLIPLGAAATPTPPTTSDLSQVDLSEREVGARAAAPEGYRVVSEEQYQAWRDTGVVPPEPADDEASPVGGEPLDEASAGVPSADDAPEPGDDQPTDGTPESRDDRADAAAARPADRDS
ncbi:hypothetical protein GCM10027614_25680 [Micromonospora vulcania]